MRVLWAILVWLLAAAPAVAPALAMESPPVVSKRSTATLVSEADSIGPGGTVRLGLRLRQAPGWHTYWRNPGDAGLPATLDFTLPQGASASPIAWPTPARVAEGPITTFAYTGEVLLPVTVTVPKGGALPVTLKANWLICEKICVPEEGEFRLDLPAGDGRPGPQAALFQAADARTPRAAPFAARIDPLGVLTVTGAELGAASVADAWFLPDEPGRLDLSVSQAPSVADGAVSLSLKASRPGTAIAGVLVLRDPAGRESAFDLTAEPGPPVAAASRPASIGPGVLAAALLGGLLLNVMPCVFPVLAMKAAGLAGLGDVQRRRVRWLAASYLLGSVVTFCALGVGLVVLRRAGELAGWGFQFQDPAFVAVAALLLFAMGLNLSGVFAVGGFLAGAGQGLAGRGGHVGSFATGALAVLVATPCTAPFMGAAITAALAAPGPLAVGVFVCLGVGLALPYVALAWLPGLARVLPRPGAWMDRLRQVLAFPLYLTVAWLAWVLAQQAGADGVLLLAVGCTVLGFCAWLLGVLQQGRRRRPVLLGLALLAGCAVAGVAYAIRPAPPAPDRADAFSVDRLASLRADGRPVFVDMTAAWCVTCLVNERVALGPESVRAAFAKGGVVLLRGDWTRRDPRITGFLRAHGSDGVPLYVFYPSGGRDPVVLPQILTPGIVLDALSA